MAMNEYKRKGVGKTILTATAVIGASTFLSMGILQAATATELKKTDKVPTVYANYEVDSSQAVQRNVPNGYKKAEYTIGDIELEYYRSQTATSKDMSVEEAAEIGAQALWEVFDVNLERQVVEMGYEQATDGLPRSAWYGEVLMNGELSFHFSVDSVTGELFSIGRASRTLDENVSVAFDPALDKDPQEFVELAKETAKKYNVVDGIVNAEYNGQGYAENDPTISIDVTGENGEIALMTFSRYDKELLGIGYSASYKPWLEHTEALQKQLEDKVQSIEKNTLPVDENEEPTLRAIELD